MQDVGIHFNETKLVLMNDIKQSKTDHLLSLWRVHPQISRTSCRVLQIQTSSPNTPDTAPSPPPNSKNFTIHLNIAWLTNQLVIARNRSVALLGKTCESMFEKHTLKGREVLRWFVHTQLASRINLNKTTVCLRDTLLQTCPQKPQASAQNPNPWTQALRKWRRCQRVA